MVRIFQGPADTMGRTRHGNAKWGYLKRWGKKNEEAKLKAEILRGAGESILSLVISGSDAQQWAQWLRVPLEHALAVGNVQLAKDLIAAGADGGAGCDGLARRTLLYAAADGGGRGAVNMILNAGSARDVNTKYALERNATPLHRAAERSDVEAIRSLVQSGACLNAPNERGLTPLHFAAQNDQKDAVAELVRLGADQYAKGLRCSSVGTPLLCAVRSRSHRAAKALLKARAQDSNRKRTVDDAAALHEAARCNTPELLRLMLKQEGASVEEPYGHMEGSVLHTAVRSQSVDAVEYLLEMGANVGARTEDLDTPLHCATFSGDRAIIDLLVRAGADVEARDKLGHTPLHHCVQAFHLKEASITALLYHGADESATDNDGKTVSERLWTQPGRVNPVAWTLPRSVQARAGVGAALAQAPADRAWRRRGWLVMLRARVHASRQADNAESNARGNTRMGQAKAKGCGRWSRAETIMTDRKRSLRSAEKISDLDSIVGRTGHELTASRKRDAGEAPNAFPEFGVYVATMDQAWEGTFRSIVSYI